MMAGMTEHPIEERLTVQAPPARCFAVAADLARYPEWAPDVTEVIVLAEDEDGRAVEAEFLAAAIGRSARYTLRYDWSGAPERLSWKLVQGDVLRSCEGSYDFTEATGGTTHVAYNLALELLVPLPGFVKRRAEVRILGTLREFKARVEALAG